MVSFKENFVSLSDFPDCEPFLASNKNNKKIRVSVRVPGTRRQKQTRPGTRNLKFSTRNPARNPGFRARSQNPEKPRHGAHRWAEQTLSQDSFGPGRLCLKILSGRADFKYYCGPRRRLRNLITPEQRLDLNKLCPHSQLLPLQRSKTV